MRYQSFLYDCLMAFCLGMLLIFFFVTGMDPYRNLNFPWSLSFVTDRNYSYRQFKLLEKAIGVTDVVVGSSTSEAFVPAVLKQQYGVEAFTTSGGGVALPLRYLFIQQALRTQPDLKRIIYVADLFEFKEPALLTTTYNQPEMMELFYQDPVPFVKPLFQERWNDFFSFVVLDRSIRSLKDWISFQQNHYHSAYHPDGSTTQSMIGGRQGETLSNRAYMSAVGMQPIYGAMTKLHPLSQKIFQKLAQVMKDHPQVQLHLVLAPFHPVFYNFYADHFEKTQIYIQWVREMRSLSENSLGNIHIHDFSYPAYFDQGITLEDAFWQDGVHFTSKAMLKMSRQIYKDQ